MKIGIITEILNTRSGSRVPIELAKRLAKKHQVTLFAYNFKLDKACKERLAETGVSVKLFSPPPVPFLGKYIAALSLFRELKKLKLDVLSVHGTFPFFLAAKLSRIPLIKTYYGTQLDAYLENLLPQKIPSLKDKILNYLGNKVILSLEKLQFLLADKIVGVSFYTTKEAKKLFRKNISYIYLGADSEPFLHPQNKKTKKANRPFTILSASRITPYKGFHILIKAVKEVQKTTRQKIKLFIVGPPSKLNYQDFLKQIGGKNIEILVDIPDSQLKNLYQVCDLYATCDRYLFFGLPPLEAACFGKPTLALNFCAASEIIEHKKTGFVAQNFEEFVFFLKRLVQDQTLGQKLGQTAKKRVKEQFSWQRCALEYEKLFEKILEKR